MGGGWDMSKTAIFCNCKRCVSAVRVFCDNKAAVSVMTGLTQACLSFLTKWKKIGFPVKYQTPQLARGFLNVKIDKIL